MPVRIGAQASQMYGVVQVPVWVTSQPAVAGTMKNARWPPVMCSPMALPLTEAGKTRAISAEAGAWYEPWISPMTISRANSASSCRPCRRRC